jgi:hypothetical protein
MYDRHIAIGEEWTDPGLELHVYAYYGNPLNRITWEQVRDTDRKYVYVNYLPAYRRFVRDGVTIKQLE